MTMSGVMPYAASRRVSAMSVASTAGWVISVCRSCCSRQCDRLVVLAVDEDELGERLAEQRRHDPVGLREGLRDDRFLLAQVFSMFTYCEP